MFVVGSCAFDFVLIGWVYGKRWGYAVGCFTLILGVYLWVVGMIVKKDFGLPSLVYSGVNILYIEYHRVILYHMVETYGGQKIGKNEYLPKN